MNTFLSVNSQLTAQPHVFAPFDGPRRVCTRYETIEERGHAHLLIITRIRHEKVFQVFTFDIDVHCGPRYAINSEESDAPSVTKMALGVTIRATVHVNIKGKDLKQLLVTYTCDAEQMSMSSLLKFLIPSANSSRTVERRENVRLGCELRVDRQKGVHRLQSARVYGYYPRAQC